MVGISVNAFDFKNSFYNFNSLLISLGIFLIWLFSTFKYSMSCIKDKLIGNVSNEFQDKERSFNLLKCLVKSNSSSLILLLSNFKNLKLCNL